MTREQLKAAWPILEAFKDGKEIESYDGYSKWRLVTGEISETCIFKYQDEYRIKPTPKLRPWKAEEVPVGALIKPIDTNLAWASVIISNSNDRIITYDGQFNTEFVLENHLYSINQGKTWLPCGVEE